GRQQVAEGPAPVVAAQRPQPAVPGGWRQWRQPSGRQAPHQPFRCPAAAGRPGRRRLPPHGRSRARSRRPRAAFPRFQLAGDRAGARASAGRARTRPDHPGHHTLKEPVMKTSLKISLLVAALSAPLSALAHKAWLQPSATVLSSDEWITVDAAVSNDLFHFTHAPLRAEALQITAPDRSQGAPAPVRTGKLPTVFDLQLSQAGTWRLAAINRGLFASWEEDGQRRRWRGTPERFAAEVPAGAPGLEVVESLGRIETYVTAGNPDTGVFALTGKGIELQPVTHPNDLFEGEQASFRLLLDGQPAAGLEVEVVRGATRYRNHQEEIRVSTDAEGRFSVTWPAPGMYWLEASVQDDKATVPQARNRRASYVLTVEVLPQ